MWMQSFIKFDYKSQMHTNTCVHTHIHKVYKQHHLHTSIQFKFTWNWILYLDKCEYHEISANTRT